MKKYGTDPELDKLVDSKNWEDREKAARQGYRLDKLVNDKRYDVRDAVNKYLEDHKYKSVFDWAKDNSIDLDIDEWLNSDNWTKREQVAKYGYGLDKLINDKDRVVRAVVVRQGYGLDKLVNDEDEDVRCAVAKQGYGLDKLVYDEDYVVRETVNKYLREHNYKSVFDWAKDNNIDIDIDEWLNSDDSNKREQVAKYGYGLDKLINDKYYWVRAVVVRQGYGLDKLVYDKSVDVRCVVAKQGYGLDKLVTDENYYVREAVYKYLKEHNYKSVFEWAKDNNVDLDIDEWLNSDNEYKRFQVAKQGYGLDKLVYDESVNVRYIVAKQSYGLDKLINDGNKDVREVVYDYLREHNYKSVFDWAKENNIDLDIDE